jgi:uncharacterized protein (DUF2141 family)
MLKPELRILIFFLLVIFSLQMAFAQTHSLTLSVEGIEDIKGIMQIGLFNDSEDFLETGLEFRTASVPVDSVIVIVVFDSLPKGNYGISLYHDLDTSGSINKNFIGIPTEPWGISNDAWRMLSAPRWKEAVFSLDTDKTIVIHLRD